MAGFVIAHEIALHRLGHLNVFPSWLPSSTGRMGAFLAFVLAKLNSFLNSPKRERDADRLAVQLCEAAGYDARACLELFDVLERHATDYRDLASVFGLDCVPDIFERSLFEWFTGYPSLAERKRLAVSYVGLFNRTRV
jgi:predicted Zn-dependent protease